MNRQKPNHGHNNNHHRHNGHNSHSSRHPLFALALSAVLLTLSLFTLAACTQNGGEALPNESSRLDGPPVQVGSKDFTENLILGELFALALESEGIPVERRLGLASAVVHEALIAGDVNLYPEYTGTGLLTVLQLPMETDPQTVFDIVQREYAERFNVVWLDMAQAENSQGIVVTAEVSERYNITTISDLQREAHNIRFASQGEFDHREDGLPLLNEVYGPINFASSTVFDNALKYEVMRAGQADAAPAYTTEGQLTDPYFVLLEDDLNAWPPYNIAPVIDAETLETFPQIEGILGAIMAGLTSEIMTELNAKVDLEGREFADVAAEYFELIRGNSASD